MQMNSDLGLASEIQQIQGTKQQVLSQVSARFMPDGMIIFEATVCERITWDGTTQDTNFVNVSAGYASEAQMIALAADNWAPITEELEAMGNLVSSGPVGAVTVILRGFVGISQAAVNVLLNQPNASEIEP
jgi:hypothetical protein